MKQRPIMSKLIKGDKNNLIHFSLCSLRMRTYSIPNRLTFTLFL